MDSLDRKIVAFDAFIGATSVGTGATMAGAFAAGRWWVVAVVGGAVTVALVAAADRSRAGVWAMFAVGVLGMGGVVWAVTADAAGVIPMVIVGMGVGVLLNRVAFGVVRPVPAARRRRET